MIVKELLIICKILIKLIKTKNIKSISITALFYIFIGIELHCDINEGKMYIINWPYETVKG